MSRNYINEIQELKARSSHLSYHFFDLRRIQGSVVLVEQIDKHRARDPESASMNEDLIKLIPISIISCYEGFFRAVCKELIDHGSPFRDNVKEFNKRGIKFDFDIVTAIQSETISMGEFISHVLSFKNLESINSNLSIILDNDFLELLKKFDKKSSFDYESNIINDFKSDTDNIIKSVKKAYELRNIYCHEYNAEVDFKATETRDLFIHCSIFLAYIKLVISEVIFPNAPETQAEISQAAINESAELQEELTRVIEHLKKSEEFDREKKSQLLDDMLKHWNDYRRLRAEYDSADTEGGTLYPTVYAGSQTKTTEELINSLKKQYKGIFEEYR